MLVEDGDEDVAGKLEEEIEKRTKRESRCGARKDRRDEETSEDGRIREESTFFRVEIEEKGRSIDRSVARSIGHTGVYSS